MRAIILAAGRGLRLRATTELPKCLLSPDGGPALLDRYITGLDALGIPATVVAGYRADTIRARLTSLAPRHAPTVVINPDYELGSILSLARGLEGVDEDILLMDGDVLFHPELLSRLIGSPHSNALLVDVGSEFTGEEYMAGIDQGRIRALRRADVPGHDSKGEWVGFARLDRPAANSLLAAIKKQIANGETAGGYEDSLASILGTTDTRCVDVAGLPWIEIDFHEDLERAAAMLPFTTVAATPPLPTAAP